ncbi:hypothetical protein WJX74_001887 [Apatococcus lobatus]|uniref:Serine protease n=1 Tax=Apatococcus lobatus TaxID=904363 RepID=A0AAW1QZS0_9CHLO
MCQMIKDPLHTTASVYTRLQLSVRAPTPRAKRLRIAVLQVMRPHAFTAILVVSTSLSHLVWAADNTHFDNHSKKWTILATTSYSIGPYPSGHSNFIKRSIPPGRSDGDTYSPVGLVHVQVQVDGAPLSNNFTIQSDKSVIAEDTPDNQYGVVFWLNDGKGNPDKGNPDKPAQSLVTIFGPGPPSTASPTPTTPIPTLDPLDDGDDDQGCKGSEDSATATVDKVERRRWAFREEINALIPEFPASGIYYPVKVKRFLLPDDRCARVKLGKVGKRNLGKEVKVRNCLVPEAFKAYGSADYAVCRVDNIGSITPWTRGTLNQIDQSSNYNLLTYPLTKEACYEEDASVRKSPWKANCFQEKKGSGSDNLLRLDCKTFPGDSGAAMYNNNDQVIAVMKGGSSGFIFTTDVNAMIERFIRDS